MFYNLTPPAALGELVTKVASRPLLLMYAAGDHGGETTSSPEFFRAADELNSLWQIPGATHTGGIRAQPEEYEHRVVGFFNDAPMGPQQGLFPVKLVEARSSA